MKKVIPSTILTLLLISGFLTTSPVQLVRADTDTTALALEYLNNAMDKYHDRFDVYSDSSAAGNHFVLPARVGNNVEINLNFAANPHNGTSCIENKFYGTGFSWGGWYLMNGVLEGEETAPKPNWGEYPAAGLNLTGATQLTFYAKGNSGTERVEFFAFGVGRDADTGEPIAPFPDSAQKRSLGYITLSNQWQQFTINLIGLNLSYVLGGFGWVTSALENNDQPITFYLDDISYDKERLDEPRFLVSYELLPSDEPVLTNTAFIYDNALALLSFLATNESEDLQRARLIGDAFVYAINNDRNFTDGRLRSAYQGGDLKLFPGWRPHGNVDTARITGWCDTQGDWYEDKLFVGTDTGNMAWSMLALISLYEKTNNSAYKEASIRLGQWIEAESRDERGTGGYTGGYEGWEKTSNNPQGQTKLLWKSTEHNIDVYVAFSRLYNLTGNADWQERAFHAKSFVEAMWDETEGHFWTGTLEDGVTLNTVTIPADIHAWSVMAFEDAQQYQKGITWVEKNCYVESDGFKGFDFNYDKDGVWFEGTAHTVIAYKILGNETGSDLFLAELRRAQQTANHSNTRGIVAASHDGVTTGFSWTYSARLHIGATAWFVLAELEYNPYWNKAASPQPVIQTNAYLVIRESNSSISYRIYNSSASSWGVWRALPGAASESPAAALADGKLYVVVRGLSGSSFWFGSVIIADNTFSGWSALAGQTSAAPTLVSNGTMLALVAKGYSNGNLWYRLYNTQSQTWGAWRMVQTGATSDRVSAAMVGNMLHLAVKGASSNLLYKASINTVNYSFSGWIQVAGSSASSPTLVSTQEGTMYLIIRAADNRISVKKWNGTAWEGWNTIASGATSNSPAACIVSNKLLILVVGLNSPALWQNSMDLSSGTFAGWTGITGSTPSKPTLTS